VTQQARRPNQLGIATMPPRWMTWAVIVFWLATTGWMVYRETMPRLKAGEPPPFTIDLTDEVGANTISWTVLFQGEKVGLGHSSVIRLRDRTFQLHSEFRFTDDKKAARNRLFSDVIGFNRMASMYRVNSQGELLALRSEIRVKDSIVKIVGKVKDGFLVPRVTVGVLGLLEKDMELPITQNVSLAHQGSIINPMHLINKISGLRDGQKWTIRILDAKAMIKPLGPLGGSGALSVPYLEAEVSSDFLTWQDQEVPCFKIEYRQPGRRVTARTWVRRRDGTVLQQEAVHQDMEIVLQRDK
jgi:hypothetical protein